MDKTDLVRQYKDYYTAAAHPTLVTFEGMVGYIAMDGTGAPAGAEFTAAVETLYPVAFGVKAVCKQQSRDFAVPKLEGLWWVDGNTLALDVPREQWNWTLMIRMPDFVDDVMVAQARRTVATKKPRLPVADVSFTTLGEGRCVQVMHVGPYSDESATITAMHEFIVAQGLKPSGRHHEVYLSDPRKTAPEKMKTVLRQPVA
jgi:hypothetical protein